MHVRVRIFGKPDTVVVVESMLTKIEQFRKIIKDKFGVQPKLQRLLYGGKFLENGYTFFDYNIKLNDVIQLMVKMQPDDEPETENNDSKKSEDKVESKKDGEKIVYSDAESTLYTVGDLVDMRDLEQGAWFEGKIVRIVYDPKIPHVPSIPSEQLENVDPKLNSDKENDSEGNHVESSSPENKSKKKGIAKYFNKSPKSVKKKPDENVRNDKGKVSDANLLYKIQLDADEDDSNLYCKLKDIRPRARKEIAISDLKVGQKVMINHNTEDSLEKGYWYDFKVDEIKKLRTNYELVGTLYLGPEAVPQNDTKARIHDKIFAIEEVVPLEQRSEEYKKMMVTQPDKRALALNCLTCRDNEDTPCKDCGCYLCFGKEFPEKIVLCDECNNGYHMGCLSPPLSELPADDWYCPSCKRDPNEVVAPGAAKQAKKTNATKTTRDWGRGMACVGKTKECVMPPNHFGPIPGIEVGMCWRFRIQLSESGVHRPPVSGIHGRDTEGAYSIVLSGGYEDDVDHGNEFTYTGSGGRDLSGNKRTAGQSCDQTLTRENRALARNCAAKHPISEQGGDAGEDWRQGKPVRVVRSYKMIKHFPKYAPKEGIRYDGIYKVVKYYPEQGLSGFRVWKYLLRRDDLSPAPWEPGAKQFTIIYPDGYLEAEAEKKALKEQNGKAKKSTKNTKKAPKKTLRERNQSSDSEDDVSTPVGRRKSTRESTKQTNKRKSSIETTKKKSRDSNSPESETEENMSPLVKKKKSNDNDKQKKMSNQINDSSQSSESENDKVIKVKINKTTVSAKKKNKRQVLNSSNESSGSEKDAKSTKNTKAKSDSSKRPNKSIRHYFDSSMSSQSEDTVPANNTKKGDDEAEQTKKRKREDVDKNHQSSDESNEDSKSKVNGHHSETKDETSPPAKKKKIVDEKERSRQKDDDSTKQQDDDSTNQQSMSEDDSVKTDNDGHSEVLNGNAASTKADSTEEIKDEKEVDPVEELVSKDTVNVKLWTECLDALKTQGKKAFTDHVFQVFMCNICQGLVVDPVTTPCQHNFCLTCLRNAFKKGKAITCPCCRRPLADATVVNDVLREALQLIFPGYDSRK